MHAGCKRHSIIMYDGITRALDGLTIKLGRRRDRHNEGRLRSCRNADGRLVEADSRVGNNFALQTMSSEIRSFTLGQFHGQAGLQLQL